MKAAHNFLVHIQYLGFRFHGWQKQTGLKTVHHKIDKTLEYVFEGKPFKTLGAGRTDSKVSANHAAFQLFLEYTIDLDWFMECFNSNLPNDIRAVGIESVDETFNIIQSPRIKNYHYLFTFGEKPHPFCASIMTYFEGELDIELMQKGAKLFEGKHQFHQYCTKPKPNTNFERTIELAKIERNTSYTASFFPAKSYLFQIESRGFLRYQVRLIMGQLVKLGQHKLTIEALQQSLTGEQKTYLREIAPASGLILNKIQF